MEALRADPLTRGSRKLIGTEDHRRLRVGELRVIYKVEHETREVVIVHVRHRKDVYR